MTTDNKFDLSGQLSAELKSINNNPILQSLLYDMGLLPEQINNAEDERRLHIILEHFKHLTSASEVQKLVTALKDIRPYLEAMDAFEHVEITDEALAEFHKEIE